MSNSYDAVVVGAGSVGVPTALFLTLKGLKVLVLDCHPSVGQGQNKSAIGGVRATHSEPAKILLCRESISILSTWKETYGHPVGWKQGGYCFPVYREEEEKKLKSILPIQKSFDLNIDWLDKEAICEVVPGVAASGLSGGTFAPDDGQASPLLALDAMYRVSLEKGCTYRFSEKVTAVETNGKGVSGVKTSRDSYSAPVVVNAAGAFAREVGSLSGIDIPVYPDSHEAGVSAPMEQFLGPMVVDLRPGDEGKTANFYFTQTLEGPVIFCYTPLSPYKGTNRESTSEFLPALAGRMTALIPRLKNILIRRVWRGLYPMTPDGVPICGKVDRLPGMYLAAGMCGQGFMLGPGIGKNMAEFIVEGKPIIPHDVFDSLSLSRTMGTGHEEALT